MMVDVRKETEIKPCCVYVIDDDFDDRLLARKELEKSEFVKDIEVFRDGMDLTDYMKEQGFMDHSVLLYTPILILVDLEMPIKDGLEVVHELKSDPFLQEIPLIVITGTEDTEKFKKVRDLGANGVFRKPLTRSMLDKFLSEAWQWPPKEMWHEYSV